MRLEEALYLRSRRKLLKSALVFSEGTVREWKGNKRYIKKHGKWIPYKEKKKLDWSFEEGKIYRTKLYINKKQVIKNMEIKEYMGENIWKIGLATTGGFLKEIKGRYVIETYSGDKYPIISIPGIVKKKKELRQVKWSSIEGLEGENILYHHTGVTTAAEILKQGLLRAYRGTHKSDLKSRWLSFTSELNYPWGRLGWGQSSIGISFQFDVAKMKNDYDIEAPEGVVELGEQIIKKIKKGLPIKRYLRKVVIRENPFEQSSSTQREYKQILSSLEKMKVPYVFVKYTGGKWK